MSEPGVETLVRVSQVAKRTMVGPSGGNSLMSNNLVKVKKVLTLLSWETLVDSALAWSWMYSAAAWSISLDIADLW